MVKAGSWHPLHSALIFGKLENAKTQLSSADGRQAELLNHGNEKGWKAIHFASHSGHVASVEWLLSLRLADPSARTCKGETALHLSAARGDEAVCKALLNGGCSADSVTREGKTALHVSSELGHMAVTRLLVVGAGLSPSTPDEMGASAAALALARGHKDVLRLLQKSCPGVPLGVAGRRGRRHPEGAALLLGKSCDGKLQSREGVSLDVDGRRGRPRGKVRPKGVDEAGHRLLKAAREGDTEVMGEILARGEIGVDWVGRSNGWTAVMEAAEHGSLESVCYLVDKGADLERTTNKGLTPLQLAVRSGYLGVTEELLRRGARPGVTTKSGRCLRCLADESGRRFLADWLFYMGIADGEHGGCACSGGANGNHPSKGKAATLRQQISTHLEPPEATRVASSLTKGGSNGRSSETAAAAAALTQWLTSLGLGEYEGRLVSQGFDTVEAMGLATEEDLEAMGFKKGHLRRFLAGTSSVAETGAVKQSNMSSPVSRVSTPNENETSKHVQGTKKIVIEDKDEEEDDGRYCDAGTLDPTRAFSLPVSGLTGDGGGSEGLFKELRPEEVEVGGVIGEGSFGVVKRGKWRGMDVAVKELKTCIASAATSPDLKEGKEEMRHEARMLAKVCNHACVVQFVGVLLRPVPSVVTRFMENGSVETLLVSSDKPASKKMVLRMAIEAAKGVIHLHREGIVHRDLASRNLLLDDGFHVRISDFGFSRVKRECVSRGYTRSDMGPIKWTSPEAMRKRCYSEASDAFSFGVVLYEMLSRRPPWEGHENLDVAYRVCSGKRMTVPPSVDTQMSSLMSRCWDQNPRVRPDFASILIALTEFAGNPTVDSGEALVEPPARDTKLAMDTMARARAAADAAAAAAAASAEETGSAVAESQGAAYSPDSELTDSIVGTSCIVGGANGAVARNGSNRAPRSARRPGGKGGPWRERRSSGDGMDQGSDHGTRKGRGSGASDRGHGGRWGGRLGGRGGAGYSPAPPESAGGLLPNGSASNSRSRMGGRGRGRGWGDAGFRGEGSLRRGREDRTEARERNWR